MRYVVHCKRAPFDVYIGRPSKWGNPFSWKAGTKAHFRVASREEAITAFENWILMENPKLLRDATVELKGLILGCWCAPQSCHGDLLAYAANPEVLITGHMKAWDWLATHRDACSHWIYAKCLCMGSCDCHWAYRPPILSVKHMGWGKGVENLWKMYERAKEGS